MGSDVSATITHLQEWEDQRLNCPDPLERIDLTDKLLNHYVYTNPDRAKQLLLEQFEALNHEEDDLIYLEARTGRDYFLSYYLNQAALESQLYRFERAVGPFRSALEIAEERGDIRDKIEVYLDYTGNLINRKMMDEAADYFDRCQRLLESYSDDQLRAWVACRHGFLYLHFYNYAKATRSFLRADKLLSGGTFELTPKDHYFYTLVHSGLGDIHQDNEEAQEAISSFRRAIERCERYGLKARLPWHQLNVGNQYLQAGMAEEAIPYFRAVIDSEAKGSANALASAYANLGVCSAQIGEFNHARRYLDQAENLFKSIATSDETALANVEITRSEILFDEEDFEQAIYRLERAGALIDSGPHNVDPKKLGVLATIHARLATAHAALDEFESAYYHQMTFAELTDRYREQMDISRQKELRAQYAAEERDRENEQLKLKASQLQLRALRAQMNPHFLYNALNSIQSFITSNDASTASKYLAKFAMLMRQSLEYTNREAISLEDEKKFLDDYLDINCKLRFDGKLTYAIKIDPELEEDIIGLPTMIVQPYVENAIEHGLRGRPSGHIDVKFLPHDENHVVAIVEDDGVGRAHVKKLQEADATRMFHKSRGTEITRSRLELLSPGEGEYEPERIDDLTHEDGSPAGTRVWVKIPTTLLIPGRHQAG